MKSAELWARALAAIPVKKKDGTPQAALNRLANEYFRRKPAESFDPSRCTIKEVALSPEELASLETHHTDGAPRYTGGAIVVVEFDGRRVVVDGNNRVNYWRAQRDNQPHMALIVT